MMALSTIKIKTTFKVVHKKVAPPVAARRKWKKFGESAKDGTGPQASTTSVCDRVKIEFLLNRLGQPKEAEINIAGGEQIDEKNTAIGSNCRNCKMKNDHWSAFCPYKPKKVEAEESVDGGKVLSNDQSKTQKYVLPSKRREALNPGESEQKVVTQNKIRISNLPEEEWPDLDKEIRAKFSVYGPIVRFSMPRSKRKNNPDGYQGFAYLTYDNEENAMAAVEEMDGERFHNLVLKVELSAQ
uniref:RRM domain-containing protein n=1 Tax=Ditylenchus dipsaci TaxID=166011 RepID=A0A915CMG3_9BILA